MNIDEIEQRKTELAEEMARLEQAEVRARHIAEYAESIRDQWRARGWDLMEVVEAIAPRIAKAARGAASDAKSTAKAERGPRKPRRAWKSPTSGNVYMGGAHPAWLVMEAKNAGISGETAAITAWVRGTFEQVAA